ncbi:uncharacterized protein BO96DRAFT_155639 [Aspergillus niger CBS 101883]|uniref:uncharacterized protein n=1 Tax=Aspergillus lacticoffeatus (strain CBS 101883) TaxID=1450533 RepID=UPI000D7ECE7F|nr:uncharacterized protein BO96DRAFT_155639 [Aspergillus niger CBS 101883]PYH52825.1 hypothetical protein BO96DRAFT_155639 [Aspergillus niger CBS 101883]
MTQSRRFSSELISACAARKQIDRLTNWDGSISITQKDFPVRREETTMASFWVAESAGPSGRRKGKRLDQARQKRHETQGTSPTAGGSGKAGRFAMGPSKECNRLLFGSTGSLDTMRV